MVGQAAAYPRDRRLFKLALAAVRAYETEISRLVLPALAALPGLKVFGVVDAAGVDRSASPRSPSRWRV